MKLVFLVIAILINFFNTSSIKSEEKIDSGNNKIENIDNKLYLFRDALDELSSQEEHELNHLDQLYLIR